jgi:DNA-binding NtrC family response regulator
MSTQSDPPSASGARGAGCATACASSRLRAVLARPERQIIDALEADGCNRQNTAKLLGLNRTTLYRKMSRFDTFCEKQVGY